MLNQSWQKNGVTQQRWKLLREPFCSLVRSSFLPDRKQEEFIFIKPLSKTNPLKLIIFHMLQYKLRFTITVIIALFLFISCNHENDDAAAIIKVLEKESATWRSGDSIAHAACWQIRPYSTILVSTA